MIAMSVHLQLHRKATTSSPTTIQDFPFGGGGLEAADAFANN